MAYQASASPETDIRLRRWWSGITRLLLAAVFLEAVLAGAMLSGVAWALRAHAVVAAALIASTAIAGILATATLRRVPQGSRLGLMLMLMVLLLLLQAAVGVLAARGANLLWVHIPLGVALFGFASRTNSVAQSLSNH